MPDFHLSKSELFFYGALASRLSPIWRETKHTDSLNELARWFPVVKEVWPDTVEPFEILERLAVEFGIARRVELKPAGYDEDSPLSPVFPDGAPVDTAWMLADGTPVSDEECKDIANRLKDLAHSDHGASDTGDESERMVQSSLHPAVLLDLLTGVPQWMPSNLHDRCFKEYSDAMGAFVLEGFALSEPGYVYRVTWRGENHRYKVAQQTNPLYKSLVLQFVDELDPPHSVLLSIGASSQSTKNAGLRDELPASSARREVPRNTGVSATPRLSAWLRDLAKQHGQEPEWGLARFFAEAQAAARCLELNLRRYEAAFEKILAKQVALRRMSTGERLAEFLDYAAVAVEERVAAFNASGRGYDEPAPEEIPLLSVRFLCQEVRDLMWRARECAKEIGLFEVEAIADGAGSLAQRFDDTLKAIASGLTTMEEVWAGVRQLTDASGDALKLAYGQLYFRELASDQLYVDPATKASILRQPRTIREQLAEAIAQYERQTLPNCTVTSVCGLIEPIIRSLAAAWLPPGQYGGDAASVLQTLRTTLLQQKAQLRDAVAKDGEPRPEEGEILLRLYCVDVAYGLHALGNTVRHHANKVLKRHDAGVMLHGLCALLHRING